MLSVSNQAMYIAKEIAMLCKHLALANLAFKDDFTDDDLNEINRHLKHCKMEMFFNDGNILLINHKNIEAEKIAFEEHLNIPVGVREFRHNFFQCTSTEKRQQVYEWLRATDKEEIIKFLSPKELKDD